MYIINEKKSTHTPTLREKSISEILKLALEALGIQNLTPSYFPIETLPPELFVLVLDQLPAEDLARCLKVNHLFHNGVTCTDVLWRKFCRQPDLKEDNE